MWEWIGMNPIAKLKNPPDNARLTPQEVIDVVLELFGQIDIDPASDQEANERIGAKEILTKEDNGLNAAWHGRVFLNPPGGKTELLLGNKLQQASISALWWAKLLSEVEQGRTTEALFVCFNLEAMLNTQKWAPLPIQAFPYCVPSYRLKYKSRNGGNTNSPGGASALVYVGDRWREFHDAFQTLGFVTRGLSLGDFRIKNW